MVKFQSGAHSPAEFQEKHLGPHFESGVIPEFPGADYYAVCYGELYAYTNAGKYLAIWSAGVPDCESDVYTDFVDDDICDEDYSGHWTVP